MEWVIHGKRVVTHPKNGRKIQEYPPGLYCMWPRVISKPEIPIEKHPYLVKLKPKKRKYPDTWKWHTGVLCGGAANGTGKSAR